MYKYIMKKNGKKLTLSERLEILTSSINNWESEYLIENKKNLSKQQVELLEGREIKSHEGMVYGAMYNNWKTQKGFQWNK